MRKYTQKELKNLVSVGAAVNLTNEPAERIPARYEKSGTVPAFMALTAV